MAVGKASGDDRARLAASDAISSKLLDITIDGARGVLFNVTGGPSLTLYEVNQAAALIRETSHPDVNMIFGAVVDPDMGDEIRITVIATGFERSSMPRRISTPQFNTNSNDDQLFAFSDGLNVDVSANNNGHKDVKPQSFNSDDWDIPAFLRNRK